MAGDVVRAVEQYTAVHLSGYRSSADIFLAPLERIDFLTYLSANDPGALKERYAVWFAKNSAHRNCSFTKSVMHGSFLNGVRARMCARAEEMCAKVIERVEEPTAASRL